MTIKWFAGDRITCLSSDTKPTTNLPTGYTAFETDTQQGYYWNGSSWTATLDETGLDIADLGGSLDVIKGGTGAITLTGVLKGNGTSAFTTLSGLFFGVWVGAFSGSSNANRFMPINGGNTGQTTEADVGMAFPYAVTLKRIRYVISGNTKDANTVISFRDDGADVQSNTTSAASNTDFDSGVITTAVAANSVLNWRVDTSLSGSGSIVAYMYAIWEGALF